MKIPTGSSFDFGHSVLSRPDRLRDDLARQSLQTTISIASRRLNLHPISRRGIIAITIAVIAGTVLRRDHTWRRRRGRRAGTPSSLEDRQCSLCLLDHAEDTVEHHMDILPLVVEATTVLRLQAVAHRLLRLLSQMMRRGERVYLINLHETRRHRARSVTVAVRVTLNRSARGVQRMVPAIGRVRRLLLLLLLLLMMMTPGINGPLTIHRHIVQKNTVLIISESA